jgi:hypothetical protein
VSEDTVTYLTGDKPLDGDLERLVDALEDVRAQLEARNKNPVEINQTLGACLAVYLIQRL